MLYQTCFITRFGKFDSYNPICPLEIPLIQVFHTPRNLIFHEGVFSRSPIKLINTSPLKSVRKQNTTQIHFMFRQLNKNFLDATETFLNHNEIFYYIFGCARGERQSLYKIFLNGCLQGCGNAIIPTCLTWSYFIRDKIDIYIYRNAIEQVYKLYIVLWIRWDASLNQSH